MHSKSTVSSFAATLLAVAGFLLVIMIPAVFGVASASASPGPLSPLSVPALFGLREVEFRDAHMSFGAVHSRHDGQDQPPGSLISALIVPEASFRINRTEVTVGGGVSLQYNQDTGQVTAGLSSCISLTTRRMVQFAVFRKESIALSYQWLPGRADKNDAGFGIADHKDADKAGALGVAASAEMSIGRVALTTMLSYATCRFDPALATAAHEFPVVEAGAVGLSGTLRWHQYDSVATAARGSVHLDTADGTITYTVSGGVYGSPLTVLDYQAMAGAEIGVDGISPVFDLSVTYKDAFEPGSQLAFEIRQRANALSASIRTKWVLD